MCVVSMVGDHFSDKWKIPYFPQQNPFEKQPKTVEDWSKIFNPPPTREQFEALKKEVEEMKELLKRAIEYDKKNNEPHCEIEEKIAMLKAVARAMGVDVDSVFRDDEIKSN